MRLLFLDRFEELQLDIVGFLAILGEGSVLANAQVSTLSKWVYVPRLLPAPQALLRPNRPSKLEPTPGRVTAVWSGNNRNHVNHIGNILVDCENMADFSVRCVEIVRDEARPSVKAKTLAPLTGLVVLGAILAAVLLVLSIIRRDGMALVATIMLSCLSTLIGLGNKWKLSLPKRFVKTGLTPPGDVVIRYPQGSFLVVKCTEDVARELYFAPENINYLFTHPPVYRLISLIGTLMLMFGVITLANATLELQIGFAAAYMFLNAAYWIVAALPPKVHWDTSCFIVKRQRLETSGTDKRFTDHNKTFTQALWKVMVVTKEINWAKRGEAAPDTPAWDQWLRDAAAKAKTAGSEYDGQTDTLVWRVPQWDPQEALGKLIDETMSGDNSKDV
ncbi:hypothetical protein H2201_007752 [Coniosporium apollinis]|uniref:Uncharacterized protein n=1 Tax=Coniosporium apollinis TaxID=61459 RepID=A0ABQ9NKL3_9PEZI|nr:hypothetical protein H2201_007752 [Coniosporium apollinis]